MQPCYNSQIILKIVAGLSSSLLPTGLTGTQARHTTTTIDLPLLHQQAQYYYANSLAINTQSTYSAGQLRFQSFCHSIKATYMPTSEPTLILFATYLASEGITHATIKVYLAAIRNSHVSAGLHSHFYQQLSSRLQLVLKGIKKTQAITQPVKSRLPITLNIMRDIKSLLSSQPNSYLHIMIWAACCLAFFGFLRVSEFTVPGDNLFDESSHLSFNSISIDNRDNPRQLKLIIKQSKTDPFRRGVNIYLGVTSDTICPLRGILPYLVLRGSHPGPLFMFEDGKSLTCHRFSMELNNILQKLNLDKHLYNTHSFRIGAATSARQACIPDSYIKMLGRWKSDAYLHYIKTPPQELARLSKCITSGYSQKAV